jgi:hypothetical protein
MGREGKPQHASRGVGNESKVCLGASVLSQPQKLNFEPLKSIRSGSVLVSFPPFLLCVGIACTLGLYVESKHFHNRCQECM